MTARSANHAAFHDKIDAAAADRRPNCNWDPSLEPLFRRSLFCILCKGVTITTENSVPVVLCVRWGCYEAEDGADATAINPVTDQYSAGNITQQCLSRPSRRLGCDEGGWGGAGGGGGWDWRMWITTTTSRWNQPTLACLHWAARDKII